MKPEVLFTGMVSTQLSSSGVSLNSDEFKTNMEEWSTKCWNTLVEANVDLSHTALGLHTVAMQWQVSKNMSEELWSGAILSQLSVEHFLMLTKKPTSILFVGGLSSSLSRFLLAPEQVFEGFKDASINFVNDAGLFMFEKNLKNVHAQTSFGYSVYDRSELISEVDKKFEMIAVQSWDIAFDFELLGSLVDTLSPGGVLVISSTNDASAIYSSSYRWHPYYDVHEALKNFSGTSYHLPQFYGTTVFVKN
jgi:hypothetical protein